MPQVLVTGAGFHGVGLPDCIRQGKEAAWQLADLIQNQSQEAAETASSI